MDNATKGTHFVRDKDGNEIRAEASVQSVASKDEGQPPIRVEM